MTALSYSALSHTASKPLKNGSASQLTAHEVREVALQKSVMLFLTQHKGLIYKVYQSNPDELHYCIILSKDTLRNRGKFSAFLHTQRDNDCDTGNIMFQFVGKQFEAELEAHTHETIKL